MLGALAGFAIFSQNHVYSAGTTLAVGDIAFTMYNSGANSSTTSGDHRFSFVTLVDLAPSTVIYFTDVGLSGDVFQTTGSGTELFLQFTTSSSISKGTQISIGNTAGATLLGATATGSSGTLGTVTLVTTAGTSYSADTGTALRLSSTGDEVFAYQTSSTFDATPTILAGVNGNDGGWTTTSGSLNASSLPSYLTNGTNAINLAGNTGSPDVRTAQFNFGSFTGSNTKAGWLATINNVSNWTISTNSTDAPFADSVSNLTISAIPEPSAYAGLAGVISLGLAFYARRKRD